MSKLKCPDCGEELATQYDTMTEEDYWICWECDVCYNFNDANSLEMTFHGTSVPMSEAEDANDE